MNTNDQPSKHLDETHVATGRQPFRAHTREGEEGTDTHRELSKVAYVLGRAAKHHQRRDEHLAELHLAALVRYAPLTEALADAHDSLLRMIGPGGAT